MLQSHIAETEALEQCWNLLQAKGLNKAKQNKTKWSTWLRLISYKVRLRTQLTNNFMEFSEVMDFSMTGRLTELTQPACLERAHHTPALRTWSGLQPSPCVTACICTVLVTAPRHQVVAGIKWDNRCIITSLSCIALRITPGSHPMLAISFCCSNRIPSISTAWECLKGLIITYALQMNEQTKQDSN